MEYDEWFEELQTVGCLMGLDIPDADKNCWYTYYSRGFTPTETVQDELNNSGL